MTPYAICSADDYFKVGTEYLWDKTLLFYAHERCIQMASLACSNSIPYVIIDNTNIRKKDVERYKAIGISYGYEITMVDLYDAGLTDIQLAKRNTHKVPIETIARMRSRYQKLDE